MTTTPNLTLPQWQKTDRIMMDDFNTAFANIDTHTVPMTVLHDITTEEAVKEITFDTATEEWWQYTMVIFTYTPGSRLSGSIALKTGTQDTDSTHYLIPTVSTNNYLCSAQVSNPFTTIMFTNRDGSSSLHTITFSSGYFSFGVGNGLASTNPLTLAIVGTGSANNYIPANSRIRVIGIL